MVIYNFKKRLVKSKGYTLIELLIGMTLIAIVFGVGFSGYREFSRRQALTGVVKQMKADLRMIQQYSLNGQKPAGVTCDTLIGYTFNVTNTTMYRLRAQCNNSGVISTPLIKEVALTNITYAATSGILFKVLGQGTNLVASDTITFTYTPTGDTATIVVGVGGDVK